MKDKLLRKLDKKVLTAICKRLEIKHSRQPNKQTLIAHLWLKASYNNIIKALKEIQ